MDRKVRFTYSKGQLEVCEISKALFQKNRRNVPLNATNRYSTHIYIRNIHTACKKKIEFTNRSRFQVVTVLARKIGEQGESAFSILLFQDILRNKQCFSLSCFTS